MKGGDIRAFVVYPRNIDELLMLEELPRVSLASTSRCCIKTDSETIFVPTRNGIAKEERWKEFRGYFSERRAPLLRCSIAASSLQDFTADGDSPKLGFPGN